VPNEEPASLRVIEVLRGPVIMACNVPTKGMKRWAGEYVKDLLILTYIFLCRVAHKANSFFLHLVRSSAAASASSEGSDDRKGEGK